MICEKIYSKIIKLDMDSRLSRLLYRVLIKIRKYLLRICNPIIKVKLYGTEAFIPFSHELPIIVKNHPTYSTNIARIAKIINDKYKDMTFIDVGANIGDSALLLRNEIQSKILCIEGDQSFCNALKKNLASLNDVYSMMCFAGEESGCIYASINSHSGTGHLERGNHCSTSFLEVKTLNDIVNEYKDFSASKMIKIDTDGYDYKILRGAKEFLLSAKPIIFFEYDPYYLKIQGEDGISRFSYLLSLNYKKLIIYDNYGDYLVSVDLENTGLLKELYYYFSGRKGLSYCDICAFHEEDISLFYEVKQIEMEFFARARDFEMIE